MSATDAVDDAMPAQGFVSGAVLAHVLDLDQRRVEQLAKAGVVVRDGRGNYNLVKSINVYCKYHHERQGRDAGFSKQRTRFIGAKADLAELEA